MSGDLKISVVIPAYNAQETLADALYSVLAQTSAAHEVIVVDDGSSDATAEVISNHDCPVTLIRQVNSGAAAALNNGISNAAGDWIAMLDADDLWAPGKLEAQERAIENMRGPGAVFGLVEAFECPSYPPEAYANLQYIKGIVPGYLSGTMIAHRSLFNGPGRMFDETLRTGHFIEWYRHQKANETEMVMLEELVLKRRIRPNTLSKRNAGSPDGLSKDYLEIARRALLEKRTRAGDGC